jgi:hypothetical protein
MSSQIPSTELRKKGAGTLSRALNAGIVIIIALVSGCAGETSTPTASITTSPSPSPTTAPRTSGPASFIAGREHCGVATGSITHDADGIASHQRSGSVTCYDEANDPRVSGRLTGTFEADGWGAGDPPPLFVEWGVVRLENDGGAWEGTYRGFFTAERGDDLVLWFTGTGSYAGLAYCQMARPAPGTVTSGYEFYGFIYPGVPPSP